MSDSDQLRKFLFEHSPVRGYLVRLDGTWRAANEHHGYPPVVRNALGEAMAATALLAGTMALGSPNTARMAQPPASCQTAPCSISPFTPTMAALL